MNYPYLKATDGTGPAVLAHVQTDRAISATVLDVDSVDNWPPFFICTVGTLSGNYLDPASVTEFRGHITAGDIIIDGFEPGFSDLGNTIGQVAVVKQTGGWADSMVANAQVEHNDNGTHSAVTATSVNATSLLQNSASIFSGLPNAILSGGVWTQTTGLNGTMTALVVRVSNTIYSVASVAARAFTASKDTYVDLNPAGSGTLVYTEVANGASAPALTSGYFRLDIVVTSASALTQSVSAGTGVSIKGGVDSLGNVVGYRLIPGHRWAALKQRQHILSGQSSTSGSGFQINGGSYHLFDYREWQIPGKTAKMRFGVVMSLANGTDNIQIEWYGRGASTRVSGSLIIDETTNVPVSGTSLNNIGGSILSFISPDFTMPTLTDLCVLRVANQTSISNGIQLLDAWLEIYWV